MFELYTEKARRVIFFARYEASQYGSPQIETEHLLLGLLREDRPFSKRLFTEPGSVDAFRKEVERRSEVKERTSTSVDLPLSQESKNALRYAAEEADRLSHKHVGCEHIVLGLWREEQCFAAEVLRRTGISLDNFRQEIEKAPAPSQPAEEKAAGATTGKASERIRELRDMLGSATQYRAQGALWGAGYVRKCQGVIEGEFLWERRLTKPRDALIRRDSKAIMLYTGQSYDPQVFELVKDGWKHDHCAVCWKMLYNAGHPEESFGHTNGAEWLCQQCYEAFWAGGQ
jgi:Clp amino terminal domain, pathogenicity island component